MVSEESSGKNETVPKATTKRITLRDVANLAGSSVATVSLVANNKKDVRISEATRNRIRKAIAQLDYRPNENARTLVTGKSRFIGLVADSIATTPFAGQIIQGAQVEAWRHGYVLLIANTQGDKNIEKRAIELFKEYHVYGILYSTYYHHKISFPSELVHTKCVLVDCYSKNKSISSVVPDEFNGGRTAANMLIKNGHRRIAFVNTIAPCPAQTGRYAGYLAALKQAHIEFDKRLVFETKPNQEGGVSIANDVVASGATGVCCHNDRVAMGLYDKLRILGLEVPDDLSVVGFDNQKLISAHMLPKLSTVGLPHYQLGVLGVRELLRDTAVTKKQSKVFVECPAVYRESISTLC